MLVLEKILRLITCTYVGHNKNALYGIENKWRLTILVKYSRFPAVDSGATLSTPVFSTLAILTLNINI